MHTPKHYQWNDSAEILQFVKQYPLAAVVAIADQKPVLTHLPFIVDRDGDSWQLTTHFYKHNPLAEALRQNPEATIIFSIPGAYVSPNWCITFQPAPTWNYMAVHFTGIATLTTDFTSKEDILIRMIEAYNPDDLLAYEKMDDKMRNSMVGQIVGLQITSTKISAKAKLSQNKTEADRENIISHLNESKQSGAVDIAAWMKHISSHS